MPVAGPASSQQPTEAQSSARVSRSRIVEGVATTILGEYRDREWSGTRDGGEKWPAAGLVTGPCRIRSRRRAGCPQEATSFGLENDPGDSPSSGPFSNEARPPPCSTSKCALQASAAPAQADR